MSPTIPTAGASSITVAVRVRPFTIREAAQLTKTDDGPLFLGDGSLAAAPTPKLGQKGIRSIIKVVDDRCLVFDPPEDSPVQRFSRSIIPSGKRTKDQTFGFDKVFDENTTQAEVYESTTKGLLDSVLDGYNATVFAYGATGCGKTHTITGTAQQPGIIFLTMQELFERIGDVQEEKVTEISLSYLEIYNETIRDLLVPCEKKQGLMLREDANQAVSVAGLSSHHPRNVEEVMDMIIRGNASRTQSPTDANATSSRSHAVLQINVAQKDRNAAVSEPHTMATLSIIDLAGSERASATRNRGERLLEGANINKSLLSLGSCINALCDPRKKNHVPYRNSKLTRLLKFSLGGNCKTVMIVCVSPSSVHFDETQNTLRYANRAKNIQTKVVRNVYNVDRHVKDYLKKIDEQMARINELQAQQKDYETFAMNKFRKMEEKRQATARETVVRIRAAYDHANDERQERVNNMKRLRHVEKRIGLITAWVGGFDQVCETREGEDAPPALTAMRQTAQGILAELEGSRQHYHQRLSKSNWDRGINTALQNGIAQLEEADSSAGTGTAEVANLKREVEVLKGNADREAYMAVLEQDKTGESALVQVLLHAHFETVAIINQIMQMDEQDAIKAARSVLGKLLTSCTEATSQVIKPDGSLQINQPVPPTRSGTPRKRKQLHLMGPSPMKNKIKANLLSAPEFHDSPIALPSPAKSSPARPSPMRRKFGGARRGIALVGSPRKRSPVKGKRGVRWRDDTEDGQLADFQPTPTKLDSTPDLSPQEAQIQGDTTIWIDTPEAAVTTDSSCPIPAPSTITTKPSRFDTTFLAKRTSLSPVTRPSLSLRPHSPLQDLALNTAPHRSPLHQSRIAPSDDTASSSSDNERKNPSKDTARRISSAMKVRTSSLGGKDASRRDRRRSPGASASPPPEGIFSASHARRMVKSEKDEWRGVLSPRSAPVTKGSGTVRRTTLAAVGETPREGRALGAKVRVSQIGGKAAWR
ncbi:hypothetical protein CAC42_4097 [Sphaceloma murrayae]|uniref:Kinesin-like protein n=1 Tax=Sphaceloma murrayae TaxID=2082308 RepID=A0A2K1QKF4_9PEZI|nr:hypothetical protein CAC42_4097 [Sphaceloma murrayae]